MEIIQQSFPSLPEANALAELDAIAPQLLLLFAPPRFFQDEQLHVLLKKTFPQTLLFGASSGGNIGETGLEDDVLQLTAIHFDHSTLTWASSETENVDDSFAAGLRLGMQLASHRPRHVLLFAHRFNTSAHRILQGLKQALPDVSISGGIASNPTDSNHSYTLDPDGLSERRTIALAFCSPHIHTTFGASSGWRPFGPTRRVTRSSHNIVYELDGESALAMYRRYLGHHLDDNPQARLLFSFEMLDAQRKETGLIRAVQSLDERNGSLVLTDDILEGGYLRLMHANTNALVGGAETAIEQVLQKHMPDGKKLALVISCVGRRILMGQQAEEEIEAISPHFSSDYQIAGFYSQGEYGISSHGAKECQILNETMSLTLIGEATC